MKTTIRIQNFKSLEDVTLELAPTTVFLGPNGAGKSSVLKMMKFVAMNLEEPLTLKPRETKYKLSEDLDFGSYREIVTNNDESRNILFELNFNYSDSQDAFLQDFLGFQNWEMNQDDYDLSIDSSFKEIVNKVFSGYRANSQFFFEQTQTIDFCIKVIFSKGIENNDLKSFEISDNQSEDRFFMNFQSNSNLHPLNSSSFFSTKTLPKEFIKELFEENQWSCLAEQQNWKNGLQSGLKIAKILSVSNYDEKEKTKLFNTTLLFIIKFYCIYSVCISSFLNILMIPSIRKNISNIKKGKNFYKSDNYVKYFTMLPSRVAVQNFYNAFTREAELRDEYLRKGINIKMLGDSDEDTELRNQYIEESNFIWKELNWKKLGLNDFKFEILQRLNLYSLGIGMYQIKNTGKLNKIVFVTQSGAEIAFSQASSGLIQLFPLLAYASNNKEDYKYIAFIEQPELHLHPELQILMADILFGREYKSSGDVRNRFIIETHSEHIIRSLQLRIARYKAFSKQLKFYYFEHDNNGMTKTKNLEVDDLGNFITPWPNGFFSEASDLTRELLKAQLRRVN